MKQLIKRLIQPTPLYSFHLRREHERQRRVAIKEWDLEGRPLPPPHAVKQKAILDYAKQYELKTLIETGTFHGDMMEAAKHDFDQLFSIELSPELHSAAVQRFATDAHIELLQGDSGEVLPSLMKRLHGPALFWLDGHFSAGETARGEEDTPIYKELQAVFDSPWKHVILIDDARCFDPASPHRDPSYPTLDELFACIRSFEKKVFIAVQDDIIRLTPYGKN